MRVARIIRLVFPLAAMLGACSDGAKGAGSAELVNSGAFTLGVQTHFGQNWPEAALPLAAKLPTPFLRDGLSWNEAETQPGRIVFPEGKLAILRSACQAGVHLILTATPRHQLYDGNMIVSSPEGVAAFLAYLKAMIAALPQGCVDAVEIGNEINGAKALPVDAGNDPLQVYVDLLRAVYGPLKAAAPGVAVLGGSTNAVGTGFLDKLFAKGMLDHIDGVAVHPYRGHAENLDWELRHLSAVMAARGKRVPIWATEFGDYFPTPEEAAPAQVKLVTLMSAAGVERAAWYALLNQKWFNNMGLFEPGGSPLPASRAFSLIQRELIPHGRAVRVPSDEVTFLFRFGTDRWVIWGAPRELTPVPGSQYFDAEGRPLAGPVTIGSSPVIVIGAQPAPGPSPLIADSVFQFDRAPWSYYGRTPAGRLVPLTPLDGQFATTLGASTLRPLYLSDVAGAAIGTATSPTSALLRYTAPAAANVRVQVCLTANTKGDGLRVAVAAGTRAVADQLVTDFAAILTEPVTVAPGEQIDLAVSPGGASGQNNTFRYRVRLWSAEATAAPCAFPVGGWD